MWRRTEGRPVRRAVAAAARRRARRRARVGVVARAGPYRPVRAWRGRHGARRRAGAHASRPGCAAGPAAARADDDLAGRRRAAAHGRPPGPRPGADAPGRRSGRRAAPDLGVPVRPPAAPGEGRQPGARGQHHGRLGGLRRLLLPRLGRRRHRAEPERGLRVRQLPDCRTVAVAFQVVLVVGSVDVVVPQNLSAAVNYACVRVRDRGAGHPAGGQRARPATSAAPRSSPRSGTSCGPSASHIQDVPLAELRAAHRVRGPHPRRRARRTPHRRPPTAPARLRRPPGARLVVRRGRRRRCSDAGVDGAGGDRDRDDGGAATTAAAHHLGTATTTSTTEPPAPHHPATPTG